MSSEKMGQIETSETNWKKMGKIEVHLNWFKGV